MNALSKITNYCLTGECPDGVDPELMEALADLVAMWPKKETKH